MAIWCSTFLVVSCLQSEAQSRTMCELDLKLTVICVCPQHSGVNAFVCPKLAVIANNGSTADYAVRSRKCSEFSNDPQLDLADWASYAFHP